MEIDALKIALLAACATERARVHRIHGELEHWLNRPLATDELEVALAELESLALVAAYRTEDGALAFQTTGSGQAIVAAQWEEFFPE